ncbi:hypothetical protein [Legionella fallonii]|uniref:Coiled-coil protein n=1 Tax=Legionella fallonii LLAP-10 TaxID=1212491 RepID=A0A098G2Q8_9GAMM|nr:hypothetical protein [Legionella fallonii]CEG56274.1 conserved protein of unknown function [Legionella fallonii LLAP-10]
MGKNATDTQLKKGNEKSIQSYSNQGSPLFFSQQHTPPSTEVQKTERTQETQQPAQEINLQTTTDILLAAILQELKTQNMLALMNLKIQQEQEQEKLQEAEKMQEHDSARFEEVRYTMYS